MFEKVLIANRGEIACRIARTLRRMGVRSLAVHSQADAHALHVRAADEAVCIGPAAAKDSYLRAEHLLEVARERGAQAIHPGYGFLSENAAFAEQCAASGIAFIGPTAEQIRRFGQKHEARALAREVSVPLLPGTELLSSLEEARREAARIGYPVILKSTAGGGGIGLRVCADEAALEAGYEAVARLGQAHFGGSGAFLEKYLERARHVEVQVFGDGKGHVLALGERDCSAQRRNQKVIEETPAPGLSSSTRAAMLEAALLLCRHVRYQSAGTVEMMLDDATQAFYFLEVNTRLQVEHGVTEAVTGLDLVEWMVRLAAGELVLPEHAPEPRGAAIEVRLYAEDPYKDFQPSTGTITHVELPGDLRCDGCIEAGSEVSPHYDPLLCKLIAHGADRDEALARLRSGLSRTRVDGIESNLEYLRAVLAEPSFARGGVTTRFLQDVRYAPHTIEVLEPGTQTTVQDFPGRLGLWSVGVPPSGPMDDFALRAANRIVGNDEGAPALELTLTGPTLVFHREQLIALTGADMGATLDGEPLPRWQPVSVPARAVLALGMAETRGFRAYLAVRGGLDLPSYLGSAATFMLGRFGGHGGRALRTGDVLHVRDRARALHEPAALASELVPSYPEVWEIGVYDGPHGAPDFFTERDIETLFSTTYRVHYNSDRTGVRLIGPKPEWAREDGGEAGLHPSNLHDNAYAIGTLDFTGDMPVILGPDGPSLGGFVCPLTIVSDERWKMGQLRPGDGVRFVRIEHAPREPRDHARSEPLARAVKPLTRGPRLPCVIAELEGVASAPQVVYRRAGDEYLLVEYGPPVLDLALRFRAHALMQALQARSLDGIVDLTPGIRSLQVHYDPNRVSEAKLLSLLSSLERDLPSEHELEVETRIVHMPLSWEDPQALLAIEKYTRAVRKDAPWCPSNVEFIRRINGLGSVEDVRTIVFDASYLVLGLGDVYLGAPVATPLDPRHRLVTTKYNPARTWTPENAVGIGGAYLCIYGMEGPGGYQLVGRTLQVWNSHRVTQELEAGKPWLLRFFDQIRFYPVEADELLAMRADFLAGAHRLRIEHDRFRFADYQKGLARDQDSIARFKHVQTRAFIEERERWAAAGQDIVVDASALAEPPVSSDALPPGVTAITSPVAGNLWKLLVDVGQRIEVGDQVAIIEAMKTEIAVIARKPGRVRELRKAPGAAVTPGEAIVWLES